MARFDAFEKSIQTTIKDEIKINSVGIQKQVKSLNSKVKEVEKNTSANKNEIAKINQKVENLDNLQEMIAAEVQKQISSKMSHIEKDLQSTNSEVSQLKKNNSVPRNNRSTPGEGVSQREFQIEKYFNRRRNLLLLGLQESGEGEDERPKTADLLQERLKIPRPKIETAFRMGATAGRFPRPLLITFPTLPQRFQVWNSKGQLNKDQESKLWLQEDLPKPLRDEMSALLRVQERAKSLPNKYPNVKIKDFKIRIQGRFYTAQELEHIPDDLKFSNSATLQSDNAVAFFGRASPLSNHHVCRFIIAKRSFTCVEHFLAWQRANTAEDKALADQVLEMKDPSEHKKVLNSLHDKAAEKWEDTVENVLLVALRAKFKQNEKLKKFLCETHPRRIGEASTNAIWGVGLALNNEEILNTEQWHAEGNRLGKALEKVRGELLQEEP